jgi:hypothetical protein
MKLAIVGSRKCGFGARRYREIMEVVSAMGPDEVISGGAFGIDSIAEEVARALDIKMTVFRADWEKHGKKAGILRNKQIVDACDELHAWWDSKSKGTAHSIELARKAGKPVTVHAI